jgi:hypothetical protein
LNKGIRKTFAYLKSLDRIAHARSTFSLPL